ncbi:hypothetical protein BDN71DRAFT_1407155 [Pleurotus eryngii]|uniref:Alpha-ketoglutarate-dependent dioxygenase AlkB-like domain-containing protein n=1 Tax=Pleurotus eryngii TaxID=5323 RepID=A0A9P6ABR2_PLEER|nr:hypothetical protein BDN71DRAFT_1407155 [Pleurotus eryngii]
MAVAWLKSAFTASDKDLEKAQQFSQRLGSPRRLDEESVNVFVDAWWIFYENQGGITLVADFLNKKRREKGFVGDLNFNKQSGGQLQDVCPANAEAVNGQSPAKRSHARDSGPETSPPKKTKVVKQPSKQQRRTSGKRQRLLQLNNISSTGGSVTNALVAPSCAVIKIKGVEPAALPVTTNAIGEGAAIQQRPHVVSSDLRPHLPQPYSVGPLRQMSSVLDTHEEAPPMPNWIMDDIDIEQTGDLNAADPSIPDNAPPTTGQSAPKPCLQIKPPLWAVSRQEVCESFDWFRSYQGGVYHANGFAKGYLLSAFAASRDIFHHGGQIIISHGGGKWESQHMTRGQVETHLADDQLAQDKSVRALIANYNSKRPLVLLIDDKYALFPFDLSASGITYAVLGFYFISDYWAEYQKASNERGRVVRYKFAFQWCSNQGIPWWLHPNASASPSTHADQGSTILYQYVKQERICLRCQTHSPSVYTQWMCLKPDCSAFWINQHGKSPSEDCLTYNDKFLKLAPEPPCPYRSVDLIPQQPQPHPTDGITTDYVYTRGWRCPSCNRLACRSKWEQWDCPSCGWSLPVQGRTRQASELRGIKMDVGFYDHAITNGSGITQGPSVSYMSNGGQGHYQAFELPHQRGRIIIIHGCLPFGNVDADHIFEEYQKHASSGQLPFRRWPLRAHKLRGTMLTHYFSQNAGAPYQYVGGADNTIPFENVPVVSKARDLIQARLRQALNIQIEFNEVLSCAYMCKQKMAFHSDAEKGLGPIVAGLSLGAPALMHFRPCSRFEPDVNKRGTILSLILRHGDILLMDGSEVQQFYEHTVVPANFRIAATARLISPENAMDGSAKRAIKLEA